MKYQSMFIGNIAEVAKPLVELMQARGREHEVFEDHALGDRFMFATGDNRILITPLPIDKAFWKDTEERISLKNWVNYSPGILSDSVCQAIIDDKVLLKKVMEAVEENPEIEVMAYTATDEFIGLVKFLRGKGLKFKTPEMPLEGAEWTEKFFGSKAGFRQTVNQIRMTEMPEGMVCYNGEEILGWAKYILDKYEGVVLKTNRGLAGAGLRILRKKEIGERDLKEVVNEILVSEPYWMKEPVIVEAMVEADLMAAGGNPNVELKIAGNKVEKLYFCGMRVTREGVFKGVEIGKGVAPKAMEELLYKWGIMWGEYLKNAGYRGFYDMDCIAGTDNKIWPLESNTRRTGGTHLYELGVRLFGKDFAENNYVAGNNIAEAPKFYNKNFETLKTELGDLFYPMKGKKEGVIVTVCSLLVEGKIGYGVVGADKKRVEEVEKEFLKRI